MLEIDSNKQALSWARDQLVNAEKTGITVKLVITIVNGHVSFVEHSKKTVMKMGKQ